ncbi:MAG: polysaccharide pyruvyl transferase family protein, partial [Gemmatimonadota bacterium]|nr:polysaccharide pyruvyl transferase family protein [Gemmatimonadota bacterium]
GGTFGDLWPTAQECREEILAAFPDNPVIQLPQSMHFESRDAFDRARAAVARHRRLTLLWRDTASLETATRELDAPSHLCPDMAFCLGPLKRLRSGTQPIVWLSRRDRERAIDPPAEAGGVTDWLDERHTALRRANYALMGATTRLTPRSLWHRLLMKTYVPLATQRLDRGIEKLSVAEVVITDRLHGSVLAMLLQIPHVLVDNAHGKLSAFHDTWLRDVEGVRFARSAEEAVMMANGLLEGPSSPQRRDIAR